MLGKGKQEPLKPIAIAAREGVLDKEKFEEMCALAVAYAEYEATQGTPQRDYPKSLKLALEILYHQNSDTVFSHSESPIETIFLNTLALCFIRNSLPLVMVSDIPDILSYTSELKKLIPQIHILADWYKEQGYEGDEVVTYLAGEVKKGLMSKEKRAFLTRSLVTYEWLDLERAYHLAIQAGFPHIKVNGKGIRADLYLWIPGREDFNLIVECDGFKYHNSQEAFSRDRKRDRALQDKHFQVRRYPGNEIWNDPVGTANDLFKYLFQHSLT